MKCYEGFFHWFCILTYHNHNFRFIIKNKWLISCNGKMRASLWGGAQGHWNLSHEVSFSFSFPCPWILWQNTWNCFCYLSTLLYRNDACPWCCPAGLSIHFGMIWVFLSLSSVPIQNSKGEFWKFFSVRVEQVHSIFIQEFNTWLFFFFFPSICVVSVCYFHALRYL